MVSNQNQVSLEVDAPEALIPLLEPKRYKGAYGGRGGAKSHFFAEQVVLRCYARKTRVVCIREVQATIKESVRQLLIDKIEKFGLGSYFHVTEKEIRCLRTGSLIVFKGMQSYNAQNIKSLEDFDIAWVEEAQTLSAHSLKLLRPTIRKDGSEIWFSWNPRHATDAVDKFFRGGKPRPDATVISINWWDNPWFPEVLAAEKDSDFDTDPESAEHVWNGGYELITEGAYYAKHIAKAEKEGRVGYFPHDPKLPVYTSWDIGVDDYTAIWFWQIVTDRDGKFWANVIDYYEASNGGADEALAAALPEYTEDLQARVEAMLELDREKRFRYQKHFLPHDVKVREWGGGARTRIQSLVKLGMPLKTIHKGIAQNPEDRINAVRSLLPMVRFNQTKRVMIGLTHLRRYARKFNDLLGVYLGPNHDEHSHGADAFGEFAANSGMQPIEEPKEKPKPELEPTETRIKAPPIQERGNGKIKLQ